MIDKDFLEKAKEISQNSKDKSTKVGCVIVKDNNVISSGYNKFPKGVREDIPERFERPLKYSVTEHAEREAVFHAAKNGIALEGSTLYLSSTMSGPPCADCTRAIIESGIKRIVGSIGDDDPSQWEARWKDSMMISMDMLKEAGINFDTI